MAKRPLSELVKTKRSMGELIDAYLWFSKQKNLLKHPPIAKIKYGFLRVTTGLSPEDRVQMRPAGGKGRLGKGKWLKPRCVVRFNSLPGNVKN